MSASPKAVTGLEYSCLESSALRKATETTFQCRGKLFFGSRDVKLQIVSNISSHIQYSFSAYSCVKEGRLKITTALICYAFLSVSVAERMINVFLSFRLKIMILGNNGKHAK